MTTCVAFLETLSSRKMTHVEFGLLNPDVVKKQSVIHVTKTTLYVRQLPTAGGLNDLRMGTSDRRLPCGTCKNDVLSCAGHPGHIELAAEVYHISMISIVLKLLRCVCFFCSRLLVEPAKMSDNPRFKASDPKERLNFLVNLCKTKHFCTFCGGAQPKYTQIKSTSQIKTEFRSKDTFEDSAEAEFVSRPFTAALARVILEHISDEDVMFLGIDPELSRPEWLILTVLQVPPPISRPSIMATDGSRARGQDDITLKLQEIVKANSALRTALLSSGESDQKEPLFMKSSLPVAAKAAWDLLQQHVMQYMHHDTNNNNANNQSANRGQRSNRPLRLVPARLKGKKGRFRGTLGGKRVDYSARTVVSPAPTFDIHEVGVPRLIAQQLTFPERVTPLNVAELTRRVRVGPGQLAGAASVVMPDGTVLDLTLCDRRDFELQTGWVVERYLRDGDWVLFNRQPSLHRMSIMAHQVRVIEDKTFRLPVCDTTPYNADFDGDEMNLHVLRTIESIAEAQELMSVTSQLISPQSNKPIIGLVQDSLVSVFLLTSKDTFLTRAQMMQLVMCVQYPLFGALPLPAIWRPVPLWTGKQLFSLLFPDFSLELVVRNGTSDGVKRGGAMDVLERCVVIKRGELCAGSLCKKTMGTSAGGVIHVLVKDHGNKVAGRFISDAQRLLVEFMLLRGFSVGVGDCMMSGETHERVNASIERCLVYGDKLLRAGADMVVSTEGCMTKLMTGVLNRAGAVVQQDVLSSNNVVTMVESGAKGSAVNIAQILGCVGQQSVEGRRISQDSLGRTLPCYARGDTTAESRGFVANSYGTGLTAQEYFFHAMGGREGLVDTAVKTASTGYIQRRLVKAEEGLQVRYDHTVRNTKEHVVQFYYGGDCFDAVYVEKQSLCTFGMSDAEVRAAYEPVEVPVLLRDRDSVRAAKLALSWNPDSTVYVTVCAGRLLERAVVRSVRDGDAVCGCDEVLRVMGEAYAEIESMRRGTATMVTLAYVRSVLSVRALANVVRRGALEWVAREVVSGYRRSLVVGGEMVGTLGAASIGEPCTQMTLNTFHTAGVGEKAVTLGVPRLKELIDTSRHMKTPSATVFFEPPYSGSDRMSRMFGVALEFTVLSQVVLTSSVEMDVLAEDAALVASYRAMFGEGACSTQWVIRFVLDRQAMAAKGLDVQHVAAAVGAYMGESVEVMCSEVNMVKWVVRVRVRDVSDLLDEYESDRELEFLCLKTMHDYLLDHMPVHGVPGVRRVLLREQSVTRVGEGGCLKADKEWVADTEGTNLRALLCVKFVDTRRTLSNDIHEVLAVFGIEAAHAVLMDEIRAVLSFDGAYVNERHLQLLVDVMTVSGTLTAMTRHSMHKLGGGTYHHASFEETQDVLMNAAAFGTRDRVSGVTENLMMGMLMPGGTGCFDLVGEEFERDGGDEGDMVVAPLTFEESVVVVGALVPLDQGGTMIVAPLEGVAASTSPVVPKKKRQVTKKVYTKVQHNKTYVVARGCIRPKKREKAFVPMSPRSMLRIREFIPMTPTRLNK